MVERERTQCDLAPLRRRRSAARRTARARRSRPAAHRRVDRDRGGVDRRDRHPALPSAWRCSSTVAFGRTGLERRRRRLDPRQDRPRHRRSPRGGRLGDHRHPRARGVALPAVLTDIVLIAFVAALLFVSAVLIFGRGIAQGIARWARCSSRPSGASSRSSTTTRTLRHGRVHPDRARRSAAADRTGLPVLQQGRHEVRLVELDRCGRSGDVDQDGSRAGRVVPSPPSGKKSMAGAQGVRPRVLRGEGRRRSPPARRRLRPRRSRPADGILGRS